MTVSQPDRATLSTTIVGLLSRELKLPVSDVRVDLPLTQYGLDSYAAVMIAGELEEQWGLELPSTLLFDCPTVDALANFLYGALQARHAESPVA